MLCTVVGERRANQIRRAIIVVIRYFNDIAIAKLLLLFGGEFRCQRFSEIWSGSNGH